MEKKENMIRQYRTVYLGGEGELIEKKSRFIATIRPVGTQEEALAFLEEMRKKYWDATHNCFAYVIGKKGELARFGDDGEPAGTAGRPMLDVLTGEGLCNICAVVTRYFGGTLLGTGGLVRAYSQSVQEGLRQSVLVTKKLGVKLLLRCDYSDLGKLQYRIGQGGFGTLDSQYTDRVELTVLVPADEKDAFLAGITEATAGRVRAEEGDWVYFGQVQGETVVFEE